MQLLIPGARKELRVVRAVTDDGQTFVGLHVPSEEQLEAIVGAVEALDAGAYVSDEDAAMPAADEEEEEEEEY